MRTQAKITDQIVEIRLGGADSKDASSLRWWQVSARPYFDKKGEFCGYRGISADITSEFRHQ
jgi:hypothetical protein